MNGDRLYQHSLTHHFIIQLIVPARPYPLPSFPIRPRSSPTRPPSVATAVLGLQLSPSASPPPSPLLYPRPLLKRLFLADLCVSSCERSFNVCPSFAKRPELHAVPSLYKSTFVWRKATPRWPLGAPGWSNTLVINKFF